MCNPASHLACECAFCLGATWRLTAVLEVLGTPPLRVSGDAPVAACGSAPGGLWRRRAMASCTCPERPWVVMLLVLDFGWTRNHPYM